MTNRLTETLNQHPFRVLIASSITGASRKEISEQAEQMKHLPVDVVEWRLDWFDEIFDWQAAKKEAQKLRKAFPDKILLATFRTKDEGGEKEIRNGQYSDLYAELIGSGQIDAVDVQIELNEDMVSSLIARAHNAGVGVIASWHNFEKTPSNSELVTTYRKMEKVRADLLKIAVMPLNAQDVKRILELPRLACKQGISSPVCAISMSELGSISRTQAAKTGSCLTFGSAARASAPGQISVMELKSILEHPADQK